MAAKKKNIDFIVNVDFVSKASREVDNYLNKIIEVRNKAGQRLSGSFLDDTIKKLQDSQKELNNFSRSINNSKLSKQERFQILTNTSSDIKNLTSLLKNLNKTWMTDAIKNNDTVLKQLDEIQAKRKQLTSIKSNVTKNKNIISNAENKLSSLGYTGGTTKADSADVAKTIRDKQKLVDSNQDMGIFDNAELEKEITNLKAIEDNINTIVKSRAKLIDLGKKSSDLSSIDGKTGLTDVDKASKRLENKNDDLLKLSDTSEQIKSVDLFLQKISKDIDTSSNDLKEFGKNGEEAFNKSYVGAEKLSEAGSTLKQVFAQFGIGITAVNIANYFKDLAVSAFQFYKSLDSALNEIYVVSNLTSTAVNGLKADFINMAKDTGVAIDDVTRSAVLFYQQGLNTEEVLEMTKVTSEFAKVAGIDATEAADQLTAAVNGYCLSAEDAVTVADKFNKVAAASAADIGELSTAFSKAAAQANQAGVSMDNYLAYIATMEEATREAPENIGTSLKTIFSRMDQIKSGDNTEDTTDVNDVETALQSVGVQLRDTEGQLRDLEDVFDELGPKWQTLDRNTQAYLGTIIAGTRQQSRFITLMQNWNRVLDLSNQSQNSAGMQALMHEKAMDSIESKMQQFEVAWQEFVSNLTNSNFIKGVITGLTKLLDLFNGGNKPIALMSIAIGLLTKKLVGLTQPLKDALKNLGLLFDKKSKVGYFTTVEKKEQALNVADANVAKAQNTVNNTTNSLNDVQQKIISAQKVGDEKEIINLKKQEEELNQQLIKDEGNLRKETEIRVATEKAQVKTKSEQIGGTISKIGTAVSSLGVAIGTVDDNLGGIVSTAGTAGTAIGQFVSGDVIGGVISAGMAIYQGVQTWINWTDNLKAKITDSVNDVQNSLEKLSNYQTGIKSTEQLLKTYDQLQYKMIKTKDEQTKLNDTIQQLSDTYDIDTVTDAYGNLHINLEEVNQALDDQKKKRDDAAKELNKQEVEGANKATGGFFNTNSLEDYYTKLFSTTRNDYKSLLTGVQDDLTDESRNISSTVASTFSSNLKNSILSEVENNPFDYISDGVASSITKIEDSINNIDSSGWNDLYTAIDYLQQNIDDLSFNDVQSYLDRFYDTWGEKNNVTQEQWDLLTDSINNTVFENSSLLDFYNKVDEMQAKADGSYYDKENSGIQKQIDLLTKDANAASATETAIGGMAGALGGLVAFSALNSWNPVGWTGLAVAGVTALTGAIATNVLANTEDEKKLKELKKAQKELNKEKNDYLDLLDKENAYINGRDEVITWINAQAQVEEAMKNTTKDTQEYLSNITSFSNFDNLTASESEDYAKRITDILGSLNGIEGDADKYNFLAQYYDEHKDEMSDDVRDKLQAILDEASNGLSRSSSMTFTQMGKELDTVSSDLQKMNKLMDEFKESGSMSLDSFMDLAGILDSIDISSLGGLENGPQYVDNLISALSNLDLAFDANNGQITANAESMQDLETIQEAVTKSKLYSMIATLKASKATTETEMAYVDAQIAAAQSVLELLKAKSDTTIQYDDIQNAANQSMSQSLEASLQSISENYQNDVANNTTWKTAIMTNLADVSSAWNAYYTAMKDGSVDTDELYKKAKSTVTGKDWEGFNSSSGIDWSQYTSKGVASSQNAQLQSQVSSYIDKLNNTKAKYAKTLAVTDTEINLLTDMANSDLSKFGTSGDKSKSVEAYIGKLKEIYNLLNKIETEEHRLSTLETYNDVAKGKDYASYLQQRIDMSNDLMDNYEKLVKAQKSVVQSEKEMINNSPVGGVFSFDQYDTIVIDYEKYIALQDEAADGQETLKQLADELYDEYTSLYSELQDDFDKYIAYLKKVIDMEQEQVDAYVDLEHDLADAVKDIYQEMLDTKLNAIDTEIDALDKLKDAYDAANKAADNSKDLSNMQTGLKRSMMDTSGASNTKVLDYREQISSKIKDMGEDAYTQRLDDIKQSLEDQKDSLQKNFDDYFKDYTDLYTMIETNILGNENSVKDVLESTDDFKKANSAERLQMIQEWDTTYHTAMDSLTNGKTIADVVNNIIALQSSMSTLDTTMRNNATAVGNVVSQALMNYYNSGKSSSSSSSSSSGGGSSSYSSSKNSFSSSSYNTSTPKKAEYVTITKDNGYSPSIKRMTVLKGSNVTLGTISRAGYTFIGWDIPSLGLCSNGNITYKASKDETVTAQWKVTSYSSPFTLPTFGLTYKKPFASGGLVEKTGPAWLDGTSKAPEAVLDAAQTQAFMNLANNIEKIDTSDAKNVSSITIDNIEFKVDSMSSAKDGEIAFNAFVQKFKEIGNQSGLSFSSTK